MHIKTLFIVTFSELIFNLRIHILKHSFFKELSSTYQSRSSIYKCNKIRTRTFTFLQLKFD